MEPNPNSLFDFLRENPLFRGCSDEELKLLLPLTSHHTYMKGELILEEGEQAESLFIIKSGTVEILKKEKEKGEHHTIATLHSQEWFGEMAFFNAYKRTASVRAKKQTELIALPINDLKHLAHENAAFAKIMTNLVDKLSSRLSTANETVVNALEKDLVSMRSRDHMGRFLIHLFILFTLFFYAYKICERMLNPFMLKVISTLIIVLFGLSCAWLVKKSGYPLKFFGLTLKHWPRRLIEGIGFSIPILLVLVFAKWVLISTVPIFKDLQLFNLHYSERAQALTVSKWGLVFFAFLYVVLIPVQEFIARGCLQGSLDHFFTGHRKTFQAILTSNLLFGLFHGMHSYSFSLVAFTMGLLWGWLYSMQKSIVGPSVSHFLVVFAGFAVLDFQHILIY